MSGMLLFGDFADTLTLLFNIGVGIAVFVVVVILAGIFISKFYRKVGPEEALVRSGGGKLQVATGQGMIVIPILHRVELMDLTLKRIEIHRKGSSGLICRDNVRADIEVAFFVRVDSDPESIKEVAQAIGCRRASDQRTLVELFDAKFSEGLKTVGRQFDFIDLYDNREKFKAEIIKVIGTDLNGYKLDDAAIDFLEQTPLEMLNPGNILDAEGIKKITELTAREKVQENHFTREKEKTLKKQDVEAAEAILELEKQRVEAVQKQEREIAEITARQRAEAAKVQEEQRLMSERARIQTEEEIGVAEENKQRQVIVALKNKQRTDAVETERVEKDRMMEAIERDRVTGVATVEKEKAIEVEKRNIQEVIRERVVVERAVVEEQQRIKDTEEFATADRRKRVAVTAAEQTAQEKLVQEVKAAEASKTASELLAEQTVIEAEAQRAASEKQMQSMKMVSEGRTAEFSAEGIAEANVMTVKATAIERTGTAEATVIERKAVAEAKGQEAKAVATEKQGTAEANVMKLKFSSEAQGIEEKAEAMKLFDGVGREHEEFKLRLNKDKDIEIAAIDAQRKIAEAQADLVGEALKSARIDIVGGETQFFDNIVGAIKSGKAIDRFVYNSQVATDVKNTFFNGNPEYFREKLTGLVEQFNLSTDDVKDLSIAALIVKLLGLTSSESLRGELRNLLNLAGNAGLTDTRFGSLKLAERSSAESNGK